jgi:hypothetical protein
MGTLEHLVPRWPGDPNGRWFLQCLQVSGKVWSEMRVLVACEFSGVVRDAFRRRGHNAWSLDLLPAADGSPYHFQMDVYECIRKKGSNWDLIIAHPPCTYLAVSGARWFAERKEEQAGAVDFFLTLAGLNCPRMAIENPIGIMSSVYRKPDQIIQPWMFGHGERKATCLWLKNLPKLTPTNIVTGREARVHHESPGIKNGLTRGQRRSITYIGIAEAMAGQWGTS